MAEAEKNTETEVVASNDGSVKSEDKKKQAKDSKPGFGSKVSKFFKDYKSEIHKIVWYGKKQTVRSTGLVIISLVVVSAVISLLDLGLSDLIMWIGKII